MLISVICVLILFMFGKESPYVVGEETPEGVGEGESEKETRDGGGTTDGNGGDKVPDKVEDNVSNKDNKKFIEDTHRTGVDNLSPEINNKYVDKGTLKKECIPGYCVDGVGFYFTIRRYEWHQQTEIQLSDGMEDHVSLKTIKVILHTYTYMNIIELYHNDVFLIDFANNDILRVRKDVRLKVPQKTMNAVVPIEPKDPNRFNAFFNMNGTCYLLEVQNPLGDRKLKRRQVACSSMEKHRRGDTELKKE